MPKCSLMTRLLQLRVSSCLLTLLCMLTVYVFFSCYGTFNYPHIPPESIPFELNQEITPTLVLKKTKPDCKYDHILASTKSLKSWEVPRTFDDFSAKGIVNGSYTPEDCNPQFSVAILVTYRNRQSQLDVFLPYMHNFLRLQNIHYKIYLIEQQDDKLWNKGLLYNIGAQYALADKFPCLILHDVDLLPLDSANLYACTHQPRHLSASLDKFRYVLIYSWLVGGALAISADHYTQINGFSNRFEGWGGEDDDLAARILDHGLQIVRFPRVMSRYTMLPHRPEPRNAARRVLMAEGATVAARRRDGLAADPAGPRDPLDPRPKARHTVQPHRLFTLIGVHL